MKNIIKMKKYKLEQGRWVNYKDAEIDLQKRIEICLHDNGYLGTPWYEVLNNYSDISNIFLFYF